MPAPTPRQSNKFGEAIQGFVDNALASAQRELEQKLREMRAQRAGLEDALRGTDSRPARLEIQSRIDRLDRDIGDLERALAKIGAREDRTVIRQGGIATTGTPNQFPSVPTRLDPVPIIGTTLGILFVAFPLALTISRFIWKRSTAAPAPALTQEHTRRFDRLEQSVDAIAIEVERISENQRYLTKLLGESRQASKIGS